MSTSPEQEPRTGGLSSRTITLWVVGCLMAGGAGGLGVRQMAQVAFQGSQPAQNAPSTLDRAVLYPVSAPAAEPVSNAPASLPLRVVEIVAPEDPFQPSAAVPGASVRPATSAASAAERTRPVPAAPAPFERTSPAVSSVRPAPAPRSEFEVTGVIEGDTALGVVKFAGQNHFLKIGEVIADTWRLEEIKERSAVFRSGEQRVEIPIQGGSSQ